MVIFFTGGFCTQVILRTDLTLWMSKCVHMKDEIFLFYVISFLYLIHIFVYFYFFLYIYLI